MSILVVLVPAALLLGALGLLAFFWCLRSDQFEDLDGAAMRILAEDPAEKPLGRQPRSEPPVHAPDSRNPSAGRSR